jgi:hypothetical protein
MTLGKLKPLPSVEQPLLIYLGLEDDRKTAVFLVDASVQTVGDGRCDPTPENCEMLRLKVGDTEFIDVLGESGEPTGEQYQLDLVKIHAKETTDAAKAARSARLAKVSSVRPDLQGGIAGGEQLRRLGVVARTG